MHYGMLYVMHYAMHSARCDGRWRRRTTSAVQRSGASTTSARTPVSVCCLRCYGAAYGAAPCVACTTSTTSAAPLLARVGRQHLCCALVSLCCALGSLCGAPVAICHVHARPSDCGCSCVRATSLATPSDWLRHLTGYAISLAAGACGPWWRTSRNGTSAWRRGRRGSSWCSQWSDSCRWWSKRPVRILVGLLAASVA